MHSTEKIVFRVSWGPRRETAVECAHRWLRMRQGLAALDPELLGRWVRYAEADDGTVTEHELGDIHALTRIVEHGAHVRGDWLGEAVPELGFAFGASTGRRGAANDVLFQACAGLFTDAVGLLNNAHLEVYPLPTEGEPRWALLAHSALGVLVDAWEPDHGDVSRWSLRKAQTRPARREPIAGYITYLSVGRRQLLPAPGGLPAAADPTPDGGLMLSLIGSAGQLPPPEQVGAVAEALRSVGAFAPTPTDRPQL